MNKIILIGNLTKDVDYKQYSVNISTFGIATNRKYGDKEEVCFIECKCFGKTADIAHKYLEKGAKVGIEGRLVLESWNDNEGKTKSKFVVAVEQLELLGGKNRSKDEDEDEPNPVIPNPKKVEQIVKKAYKVVDTESLVSEDEIPF